MPTLAERSLRVAMYGFVPSDDPSIIADMQAEINRLQRSLRAASGYLLNAQIELETGATKRAAIQTIDRGLKLIESALKE